MKVQVANVMRFYVKDLASSNLYSGEKKEGIQGKGDTSESF